MLLSFFHSLMFHVAAHAVRPPLCALCTIQHVGGYKFCKRIQFVASAMHFNIILLLCLIKCMPG